MRKLSRRSKFCSLLLILMFVSSLTYGEIWRVCQAEFCNKWPGCYCYGDIIEEIDQCCFYCTLIYNPYWPHEPLNPPIQYSCCGLDECTWKD